MPKRYWLFGLGEERFWHEPGKYAGSRKIKIFGRLDCPSGKRKMLPANRIFFRDWQDAVEAGYRPCKVCRPDEPRLHDRLSEFHPALSSRHVAIWQTRPFPYRKKPAVCFYVAMMWDTLPENQKGIGILSQVDLEEWMPYPAAIARAITWGKRLGLPVIDRFWKADNLVRFMPGEVSETQRKERLKVLKNGITQLTYPSLRNR